MLRSHSQQRVVRLSDCQSWLDLPCQSVLRTAVEVARVWETDVDKTALGFKNPIRKAAQGEKESSQQPRPISSQFQQGVLKLHLSQSQ